MEVDGFVIEPLTPDRFGDLEKVLGPNGASGCWCMYWMLTSNEWTAGAKGGARASNKTAFREIVAAGPPPGLIAYEDGDPVGWCRVVPRTMLPGLDRSQHFRTDLATEGVWSLSCFRVRSSYRGRGLTGVLTKAAAEYARGHGATALEAYPFDTPDRKDPMTVYLGVASTFERLGFDEVQRKAPHKPMMRLNL